MNRLLAYSLSGPPSRSAVRIAGRVCKPKARSLNWRSPAVVRSSLPPLRASPPAGYPHFMLRDDPHARPLGANNLADEMPVMPKLNHVAGQDAVTHKGEFCFH